MSCKDRLGCDFATSGICRVSESVKHEATNGEGGPAAWQSYTDQVRRTALGQCQDPDTLNATLDKIRPTYKTNGFEREN